MTGTAGAVRIGLTGPIGCGKSTVAGWLAERPGRRGHRRRRCGPRRPRRRDTRARGASIARFGAGLRRRRWQPRPRRARPGRLRRSGRAARPRGDRPPGRPSADRRRACEAAEAAGAAGRRHRGDQARRGRPGRAVRRGLARHLRPGGPGSSVSSRGACDPADAGRAIDGPGRPRPTASGPSRPGSWIRDLSPAADSGGDARRACGGPGRPGLGGPSARGKAARPT